MFIKKLFLFGLVSGLVLGGLGGVCGWSGSSLVRDILANQLKTKDLKLKTVRWCFNGLPFVDRLETLLDNKTYLVVLQNNRELRPSGGFMGSYAKLIFKPTGLAGFEVQDIYVPDGQIVGHVEPPRAIQQAFGQGWWKLRDANWDPDFTVAAPQILWFFDQGGVPADGLAAVNLSLVNSFLEVLGEVDPLDYGEKISAATFYDLAQKYAETGFFPGSTQKRDFLSAVGNALMRRMIAGNLVEKLKIAKVIWQQLKGGEIMIWFADPDLQTVVHQRGWGGKLTKGDGDYLYIVETNLGANKANCCVGREVRHEIGEETETVTINYQNNNPLSNPVPPAVWGGDYVNYLRVVIPAEAKIDQVVVGNRKLVDKDLDWQYGPQEDRYQVSVRDDLQTVGFWVVVQAQQQLTVEIKYTYKLPGKQLTVKKQPGMAGFPYKLMVNSELMADDTIDRDRVYTWTK